MHQEDFRPKSRQRSGIDSPGVSVVTRSVPHSAATAGSSRSSWSVVVACGHAQGSARSGACAWRSARRSPGVSPKASRFGPLPIVWAAPSTISREVAHNGGRARYRAHVADRRAWHQAQRPKPAKLALCPRLRHVVERKLERRWSPREISRWLARTFPDDPELQVSRDDLPLPLCAGQGRSAQGTPPRTAHRAGDPPAKGRGGPDEPDPEHGDDLRAPRRG